MSAPVTVGRLFTLLRDEVQLELVGDDAGLARPVPAPEISSPGLALAGYVKRFPANRLQVFGETEITYLSSLEKAERERILQLFFGFPIPCVFVTKAQHLPGGLTEAAAAAGVPLLRSALKTAEFYRRVKPILEVEFAPSTTLLVVAAALPAIAIASLLPASFAGFGGNQAAAAVIFKALALDPGAATLASLLFFTAALVISSLAGVVCAPLVWHRTPRVHERPITAEKASAE